jgi:hypothetical protein
MKTKLLDLLLKTRGELADGRPLVQVFRALTDKEIVLLIAEKELTGELVSWKAIPAANPGLPVSKTPGRALAASPRGA